jgi:hypothetical protein
MWVHEVKQMFSRCSKPIHTPLLQIVIENFNAPAMYVPIQAVMSVCIWQNDWHCAGFC